MNHPLGTVCLDILKGEQKKTHESFDKFTGWKWVQIGKIKFLAFLILWFKVQKRKEKIENDVLKKKGIFGTYK